MLTWHVNNVPFNCALPHRLVLHSGLIHQMACLVLQERRNSREYTEGFAMLDLDDGAPWDLVCSLMQAAPRKRLSASAAAAHPALGGGITAALNSLSRRAGDAADRVRAL